MGESKSKLVIQKDDITAWPDLLHEGYCNEKILNGVFGLTKEQTKQILTLVFVDKVKKGDTIEDGSVTGDISDLNPVEVAETIDRLCGQITSKVQVVDRDKDNVSDKLCRGFGVKLKIAALLLKLELLGKLGMPEVDMSETFSKLPDDELKNILLSGKINCSVLDSKSIERILDFISSGDPNLIRYIDFSQNKEVLHKIVDHFVEKKDYRLFYYFRYCKSPFTTYPQFSTMLDHLPNDDPGYMKWIHNLPYATQK